MSAAGSQTSSSCPGKSAERVFAQMSRTSTTLVAAGEDVDVRDKPGHDGTRRRRSVRTIILVIAIFCAIVTDTFVAWIISLGPLPLAQASEVSTTIVLPLKGFLDRRRRIPAGLPSTFATASVYCTGDARFLLSRLGPHLHDTIGRQRMHP